VSLHLVQGTALEYGSIQEGLAITAWRKQQRIELYRTIAVCTATVNPEKAQGALRKLVEEMFPEVAKDREKAIEKAMEIMEAEKEKSYSITPVGQSLDKGTWGRMKDVLKQKRKRGR
jgi:S-adenosylmethionine synthetase